ncbi:MAG: FkbM family methyltransferase [Verrucomicrobiota bacterium]|nr:FkbM family methyltransferase [Verrucomicrobiota bacterium]
MRTLLHKAHHLLLAAQVPKLPTLCKRLNCMLLPPATGPVFVTTNYGVEIKVDPTFDKGLEREIYYTGNYEVGTLSVFRAVLRPGDVFIDIGANIGLMTLTGARAVGPKGQVFAFEANPTTFHILQENIQKNKLINIRSMCVGLGETPSSMKLYVNTSISRGSASLLSGEEGSKEVVVDVITLDDYFQSNPVGSPRLIKIDVEGFEIPVMKGGTRLFHDNPQFMVCFEYDGRKAGEAERTFFNEQFKDWNIYRLRKGKSRISKLASAPPLKEMRFADNLFAIPKAAQSSFPAAIFE